MRKQFTIKLAPESIDVYYPSAVEEIVMEVACHSESWPANDSSPSRYVEPTFRRDPVDPTEGVGRSPSLFVIREIWNRYIAHREDSASFLCGENYIRYGPWVIIEYNGLYGTYHRDSAVTTVSRSEKRWLSNLTRLTGLKLKR